MFKRLMRRVVPIRNGVPMFGLWLPTGERWSLGARIFFRHFHVTCQPEVLFSQRHDPRRIRFTLFGVRWSVLLNGIGTSGRRLEETV